MLDVKITERLYQNSHLSYLATGAGSILVYWLFQSVAPSTSLTIWFVLFLILTVIRFLVSFAFQKYEHAKHIDLWFSAFLCLAFISGTMWGLTGFIFIPKGSVTLLDSVLYHGMLLMFIAVLIAGSLVTYSISKLVYLSFSFPAIVPQCLMLVAKGDVHHSFLGGFMLVYAISVFIISVYINRMFTDTCRAEAENEILRELAKGAGIKVDDIRIE